ncbi:MAG: hypothetical protein PHU01_08180, partial [Desulfuromonadaceae bacterium]|nr:hypothetical protein [Desulfuromonadaceae bacterium]
MKESPKGHRLWPEPIWYIITILIFVLLVSIGGYLLVEQQKEFLLHDKQLEIQTIADLKTNQLVQWRKERFAEGASIRANAMIASRVADFNNDRDKSKVKKEIRLWIENLIDLGEYSDGILFKTDGDIIFSSSKENLTPSRHNLYMLKEAVIENELILSDFHRSETSGGLEINLVVPIMYVDDIDSKCVAVLILCINPLKRLYPLIQSWPTNSK